MTRTLAILAAFGFFALPAVTSALAQEAVKVHKPANAQQRALTPIQIPKPQPEQVKKRKAKMKKKKGHVGSLGIRVPNEV